MEASRALAKPYHRAPPGRSDLRPKSQPFAGFAPVQFGPNTFPCEEFFRGVWLWEPGSEPVCFHVYDETHLSLQTSLSDPGFALYMGFSLLWVTLGL